MNSTKLLNNENAEATYLLAPDDGAINAIVAQGREYELLRSASDIGKRLSLELKGGKKAHPNVSRAATVAEKMELYLLALQRFFPGRQVQHSEPKNRPNVLSSDDLPTVIGSAASDARYLKFLTSGGMGMSTNVVEPLRVLRECRMKLAVIQERWPELQNDAAILEPSPNMSHERIFTEMIAAGEVSADIFKPRPTLKSAHGESRAVKGYSHRELGPVAD